VASWAAPKDLALELFKKTKFKNRAVATKLKNKNWIRSLGAINSSDIL
jgi:hypothetical protein